MKALLLALSLTYANMVFAQAIEPGEWEFTTEARSPMLPKPQNMTSKRCITKEDAENPEKLFARQSEKNDCKFTPGARTGDSLSWEMECAKSNMRGTGTARFGQGTLESEMRMTGEMQGHKFNITSRTTGKRLGPCKS